MFSARTERRLKTVETIMDHRRSDVSFQTSFGIEFECQSGNFSDCIDNMADDVLPEECNGVLMFTNKTSSCGAYCENFTSSLSRSNKIKRKGWTLFTR